MHVKPEKKRPLVTGGCSGIDAAIVPALASAGAKGAIYGAGSFETGHSVFVDGGMMDDPDLAGGNQAVLRPIGKILSNATLSREVNRHFIPDKIGLLADAGAALRFFAARVWFTKDVTPIHRDTAAYDCENFTFQLPTTKPDVLVDLLLGLKLILSIKPQPTARPTILRLPQWRLANDKIGVDGQHIERKLNHEYNEPKNRIGRHKNSRTHA